MKKKLFGFCRTNREGLALISVLGVVTLATILILALFSVSDAEFKSAKTYSDGAVARQMADNAVNMVVSQIQAASVGAGVSTGGGKGMTIWASQPGGVRVYKNNGEFALGRRLYSDSNMVYFGTESRFSRSSPAATWQNLKAQWVDLNEPVVHAGTGTGSSAGAVVSFPIVDPRASRNMGAVEAIEGFSYTSAGPWPGAPRIPGVVDSGDDTNLRLPMPVEWLYILKDGSMGTVVGTPDGTGSWSGTAGSGTPTKENPIIGRVGFWTDDESSKVNVNTAGEPGYFATPTVFHGRDWNWSQSQPFLFEFQRYPGHPATVALSSVLHPNPEHAVSKYDADSYPSYPPQFLELKTKLTDLAPRLAPGATADGTRSYAPDEFSKEVTPERNQVWTQVQAARAEHLFASVDELMFKNLQTSSTSRDRSTLIAPTAGELLTPALLDRARFFMTAQSRAPETNMFGYPRVAIWPVPDESLGPKFRTVYDTAVAFAGSLGSPANAYYFRRRDANSAIVDIGDDAAFQGSGLTRNKLLMGYLDKMISTTAVKMPGGLNFSEKYPQDARQILVEIFDYIRITNLYDSFLDELYVQEKGGNHDFLDDEGTPEPGAKPINSQAKLWTERPVEFSYYTYTAPRFDTMRRVGDLTVVVPDAYKRDFKNERVTTGMYPGHGQVRPIEWTTNDGQTFRGLGRFPTVSEVALHFICTADGKTDAGSYLVRKPGGVEVRSGGKTAKRIDEGAPNKRKPEQRELPDGSKQDLFWYSNIPPYPNRALFEKWGCTFGENTDTDDSWTKHPGANPLNWNCTLDVRKGENGKYGVELEEDEKRIQIAMQIELFVPAVGYTKYCPDFTLVLDGRQLAALQVQQGNGDWTSVFNTTEDQVVQSTMSYTGSWLGEKMGATNISPVGGNYGAAPLMSGRVAKGVGEMPADGGYNDKASSDPNGQMLNFPLVSSFFTVKRKGNIQFRNNGGRPLKIDVYAAHDRRGKNATPSQSVYVNFPSGQAPVPKLVVYSTEKRDYLDSSGNRYLRNATSAPRWWAFNAGGALNRYEGTAAQNGTSVNWAGVQRHTWVPADGDTRGRFTGLSNSSTDTQDPHNKWVRAPSNAAIPMSGMIYGYSPIGAYSGVQSRPSDLANEDGFQDEPGKMGNYPCYGSDSIRSIMPAHGDYRVLAGRKVVPETVWQKHRVWDERPDDLFAHSLSGTVAPENGFDTGAKATAKGGLPEDIVNQWHSFRMVQDAWYPTNQVPDTRLTDVASKISTDSGDFDNGPGNIRDGPYINKPDDGNLSVGQMWYGNSSKFAITRNAYFIDSFLQFPASGSFFTPNRMISSPGMFGSLPTGVFGSKGKDPYQQANGVPWRTLLFRPDPNDLHVGATAPYDHYYMDLFWMPVVQPYAISDSFSTAGKINLNYAMLGMPHITRATGLHAAMKGELLTAFSKEDVDPRKTSGKPGSNNTSIYKTSKNGANLAANSAVEMWGSGDDMDWHRHINIPATLRQLEERFYHISTPRLGSFSGLMRTASQLCEVHLVPVASPSSKRDGLEGDLKLLTGSASTSSTSKVRSSMTEFWKRNNITGDNVRERPYANLYQKFTTRSNTYRVHFIAQTIKKARSVDAGTFDDSKDSVTAEYRGSALLERYLDFTSSEASRGKGFLDYANSENPFGLDSLEASYHYRVLEMKQFTP